MSLKQQIQNYLQSGRLHEAKQLCVNSCVTSQLDPDIWVLSAIVHGQFGQYVEAESYALKATQLSPTHADAYFNLGVARFGLLKFEEAEKSLTQAISLNPQNTNAHFVLGVVYGRCNHLAQEADCYKNALKTSPAAVNILYALGKNLNTQGLQEEAITYYDKALNIAPNHIQSRLGLCIAQIPVIYKDKEHIINSRKRYQDELKKLNRDIRFDTQTQIIEAATAVGDQPNFFLTYQGMNDLDLQQLYGSLIEKIQSHMYPQWSKNLTMPEHKPTGRIRVGIVSRFFCNHSNWKMPIKGWLTNLNKDEFELYGYYTGMENDDYTEQARGIFDHFFEGTVSVDALCSTIRKDNLHMLIYPEIGMDQLTMKLASLRLAPIQCSSWGHPETSGLSTIDYFLSSELMEPDNASKNYSERLVKLNNLSIYYEPLKVIPATKDCKDYGIKDNFVVYFCAQSLFKYLPEHDHVFADIASRVDDCQFIFIRDANGENINNQFITRLKKAFTDQGLDYERHVVLIPKMDSAQYKQMNLLADIFLDSIGWSGCNSTIEAIECGLPLITLPGNLMRSRHSYAFLTMMEVTETIAENETEYINIAVKLADDRLYRAEISDKINKNKRKLYNDMECITSLERFIKSSVDQYPKL